MDRDREDSGIMEMVAIAALLFLFWKFFIKKKRIPEPATTPAELKDQFAKDPNFNLNDYCKDVIYRPLSSSNLTQSNLLGEGWCYRGDRSAIDESKGFGDAYAEKQADNYQSMKEEEAIFVNNKLCVQFRLINSTASPVTTDVLNTTIDVNPFNPAPDAVLATAATSITPSGFTANWNAVTGAIGYYLDIATDSDFLSFVAGYNGADVNDVTSEVISGLDPGTTYFYRVRAYNESLSGANSNIITATTLDVLVDEDGNIYNLITVGSKQFITTNFKCTKYADGTPIPNLTVNADWIAEDGTVGHDGAYCAYNNNPANIPIYGLLYNGYAIENAKLLAPAGWRVATDADIIDLRNEIVEDGGKLKEVGFVYWDSPNTGATNEIGFNGYGAGLRLTNGVFDGLKRYLQLWTSEATGMYYYLTHDSTNIINAVGSKKFGFSVRLVRDLV